MFFKTVTVVFIVAFASATAQFAPAFFGAFPSGFVHPFNDFGAATTAQFPSQGDGRSMTGPIQFPTAPTSSDTSGVVVGASGYGFVPPGGKGGPQGRGLPVPPPPPPQPASAAFTASFGSSPFEQTYFHL